MQVPTRPWSRPKFTTANHHHAHTRRCHIKTKSECLVAEMRRHRMMSGLWTPRGSLDRTKWEQVVILRRRLPSPRGCHTANTVQNGLVVVGGGDGREYFQTFGVGTSLRPVARSQPHSSLSIQANVSDTAVWTQTNPGTLYRRPSHSSNRRSSAGNHYVAHLATFVPVMLKIPGWLVQPTFDYTSMVNWRIPVRRYPT